MSSFNIYLICVWGVFACVNMCIYTCHSTYARSKYSLWESILTFYHVNSEDWSQVFMPMLLFFEPFCWLSVNFFNKSFGSRKKKSN